MSLKLQQQNIARFEAMKSLPELIEYFERNYKIEQIIATPVIPLNGVEVLEMIKKRELIPIQKWSFEKPEYPEFPGYAQIYFKKSAEVLDNYETLIKSSGHLDQSKRDLEDAAQSLHLLIKHHIPETRFSITGNVKTQIELSNQEQMDIPLLGTDYLTKPQELLLAFRLRGEFFMELLIRVERLLGAIEMRLSDKPSIKVIHVSKAQYIIYEFVSALGKSGIFEIPKKEIQVLEKKLFELLDIPKPKYRSDITGNINRKGDAFQHLRAIVPPPKTS